MERVVAIDFMRLFWGALRVTPRGIDRVDLGYARYFFENRRGDCVGVMPTPLGTRWFDRSVIVRCLNRLEDIWRETQNPDDDAVFGGIEARLRGVPATKPMRARSSPAENFARAAARQMQVLAAMGLSTGRPMRKLPPNALYLNTGQIGLMTPALLQWLRGRGDVASVFMVHDTIPIEYREYVHPSSSKAHNRLIDSSAAYAKALITPSAASRDSIIGEMVQRGRSDMMIGSFPLPVADVFLTKDAAGTQRTKATHPYFVICGSLDLRKNHTLILNIWRELSRERGKATPKLVIVGSMGWGAAQIMHFMRSCEAIQEHVIPVSGLSSPALRELLIGASALLMPSFAEGFGLPIAEALAVGTPVIASDLPAHREAAGEFAHYLNPIDGVGWLSAVRDFADSPGHASAARQKTEAFRPTNWSDYFVEVERFIDNV